MLSHIEKCPGGLAVVLPESLAVQSGLHDGGAVDIELTGGRLVIRLDNAAMLDQLLARITPENRHDEWATGSPVGAELL